MAPNEYRMLDAKVADKVFGYGYIPSHYSTRARSTLVVWNHLVKQGYAPALITDDITGKFAMATEGGQSVQVDKEGPDLFWFVVEKGDWYDTVGEAICQYALKVIEE